MHAINDHGAASQIQVRPTSLNALVKQDIEVLANELEGFTLSHASAANGMLSSMATKDDIRDLKILLRTEPQSATRSQTSPPISHDASRLTLVLTIPQLRLPAREVLSILKHFSAEVEAVLNVFFASFMVCLRDLLLALPQMYLIYRVLQRLPQAVSLVLHDNIIFEDALGRMQILQFQQFRHWTVFEASLRCNFENLPGMQKVLSGQYVLTTPKHRLQLTPQNWSEVISPGFVIKMAIMINTIQTNYQKCPRKCGSKVSKVTDVEYRCDTCQMVFSMQLEPPEFGSKRHNPDTRSSLHNSPRKGPSWRHNQSSSLADISKSSRDVLNSHRTQLRTIKVRLPQGRARTALTSKDPLIPPELDHKDDEQQGLRLQTEAEELKVLKRVYLTGKDPLEYRFGFSSSQFPDKSVSPKFATGEAQPRSTQTEDLVIIDEWSTHYHLSEDKSKIRSTDMPALKSRVPSSTSPTLDPAEPESLGGSPSHQSTPIQKTEKRFICEGKLRSAPGTTWGCSRRYATINALSRHLHSEVGQICIKPLIDEEQGWINDTNNRQIHHALEDYQMQLMLLEQQNKKRLMMARQGNIGNTNEERVTRPDMRRDLGTLPESLLVQYPLLSALEQRRRPNYALEDYQMQLMLLEQQNKKRLMMAGQEKIANT